MLTRCGVRLLALNFTLVFGVSCLGLSWQCALVAQDPPPAETPAAEAPATEAAPEPAKVFPDPGLEAAVRAQVFAKRYNTEPLTVEDVKNISRVDGAKKGIKSLEGLQHCTAVMSINFAENEIEDLGPVAGLVNLQSINLAKNKISDIKPLEGLIKTQLLDISGNRVASLEPVVKMSNLRSLYVADNKIQSLEPVAGLAKIWTLDAAGNGLSDIAPVGKLAWLTTLDLDRNQIESLEALRPLTELNLVLLRENKIKDVGVLVEMCQQDAGGDKRFAPYLRLYLRGNPLGEAALGSQLEQLRGCRSPFIDGIVGPIRHLSPLVAALRH
jgi:internalin A